MTDTINRIIAVFDVVICLPIFEIKTNLMRRLVSLILLIITFQAEAQSPCDDIMSFDYVYNFSPDYTLNKLRYFNSDTRIPDSTRRNMQKEIGRTVPAAFFKRISFERLLLFDSTDMKRLYGGYYMKIKKEGKKVDSLYIMLYQIKMNDSIPFIFRVDFNYNGKMVARSRNELVRISKSKPIISCQQAVKTALAHKAISTSGVDKILLCYDYERKKLIWQVIGPMAGVSMNIVKLVDAVTGNVIMSESSGMIMEARPM
jgi:hypothetical protein